MMLLLSIPERHVCGPADRDGPWSIFLKPLKGNHQNSLSVGEAAALAAGLSRLARNLWWTWNQDALSVFEELSPRGWRNLHHNPVAVPPVAPITEEEKRRWQAAVLRAEHRRRLRHQNPIY